MHSTASIKDHYAVKKSIDDSTPKRKDMNNSRQSTISPEGKLLIPKANITQSPKTSAVFNNHSDKTERFFSDFKIVSLSLDEIAHNISSTISDLALVETFGKSGL